MVFTTCAVAAAVHYWLGWQWGVAFVLGAIVAPPDVVAPLAIARRLGLPRRVLVVLEGEGLANDATALILYRFAVVAISTGSFSMTKAGGTFVMIVLGEIFFGIGVGWLSLRLRQWAQNPRVEITLSLMTPYLAYGIPEHLGGSGVLATVAAGLYVSWNGPRLISAATRLQGIFFWDLIIYLIEGFVFLITGLQARTLIEKAHDFPIRELLVAIAITVAIVIVGPVHLGVSGDLSVALAHSGGAPPRSVAAVAADVHHGLHRRARRRVARRGARHPADHRHRRAVSASRPDPVRHLRRHHRHAGRPGPDLADRHPLARRLGRHGKAEHRREQEAELAARNEAIRHSRQHLKKLAEERNLSAETVAFLNARHDHRERLIPSDLDERTRRHPPSNNVRLELIAAERDFLHEILRDGKITDESRRRLERDLDLEEATILARREGETPL